MSKMRIVLVDDHEVVRLGLKVLLEQSDHFEVVGEANNAKEAVEIAGQFRPDIVLMDINLKGDMNGIDAAKEISEMGIPIIFLTANTDDFTTFEALKTVPQGYLSKPYSNKDLELTIGMVLRKHEEDIKTIIKTEDKVSEKIKNS